MDVSKVNIMARTIMSDPKEEKDKPLHRWEVSTRTRDATLMAMRNMMMTKMENGLK